MREEEAGSINTEFIFLPVKAKLDKAEVDEEEQGKGTVSLGSNVYRQHGQGLAEESEEGENMGTEVFTMEQRWG
jgi:hypothetical protein